jgi:UDP-N-acetylglucosamine 2-epimerase (non-hydrolysing)
MKTNQSLGGLTARAIAALDEYLAAERPQLVIVQGDTTTVFCAALVSFYHQIHVGHVEAGLRTWNLNAPWPEEANRTLVSRLATLHFAPTETNRQNLLREGVPDDRILVTGNTVIDALLFALDKVQSSPPVIPGLPEDLQPSKRAALEASCPPSLVLVTGHRRENFGRGLETICRAIAELARRFPQTQFVYPVHLNPNVRRPVHRILGGAAKSRARPADSRFPNVHLIEPISYLPFVWLMSRASLILTDSGGIQEEAPTLGKPVLVMREATERPEAVAAGVVKLVGTNYSTIVREVSHTLQRAAKVVANSDCRRLMPHPNPYGDGQAAGRIVEAIARFLTGRDRKARRA